MQSTRSEKTRRTPITFEPFRPRVIRDRVRAALAAAREIVPDYGTGRTITTAEIHQLARAAGFIVSRVPEMDAPAAVWPRLADGRVPVFVAGWVGPDLMRYVLLHELGHHFAGDLEEPTMRVFRTPLPEQEPVADLFALHGVLTRGDLISDVGWIEDRIRTLVPLDDRGWCEHRVPRLAQMMKEITGGG